MAEFTRDQLWKAILEDLFDDFLRWFYEPHLHLIDFKRPFEFDEEVHSKHINMGMKELVEKQIKEVALEQGLQQGLKQGLEQGMKQGEELTLHRNIEQLLRNGFTVQQVVNALAVPEEIVQKIHNDLSAQNEGSALQ